MHLITTEQYRVKSKTMEKRFKKNSPQNASDQQTLQSKCKINDATPTLTSCVNDFIESRKPSEFS